MITLDNLEGSFSHPYRNFSISSENRRSFLSQRNGTRQKIVTSYEFASNRPRGTMCMIIFHRNVTTGETRRTLINKEKSMEELFVHGTRLFASCQRLDLTHSKPVEPGEETGREKSRLSKLRKNIVNERR